MTRGRLLHITPHMIVGGAERLIVDLTAVQRSSWTVAVAGAEGVLADELHPDVQFFPMPGYPRNPRTWRAWREPLAAAIRDFRPEVIHAHAFQVLLPAPSRIRSHHSVLTIHSGGDAKKILGAVLAALGRVDVVAVSPWRSSLLERLVGRRAGLRHVANGVDTAFWSVDSAVLRPRHSVLWVGRLEVDKAPLDAVRVIERLVTRQPGCSLTIVGGGSLADRMVAAVATSPARDHVRLIGRVDRERLRSEYRSHEFLLNTSRREAMPISVLEAMTAGCVPVIPDLPQLRNPMLAPCPRYPPGDVDRAAQLLASRPSTTPADVVPDIEDCAREYELIYRGHDRS